jgi:SnoaL-like domain
MIERGDMHMDDIAELRAEVRFLKDHLEITQLLMMHPLAIDACEAEFWMSNWTEDSVFDRTADPNKHSGNYQGTYGKPTMLEEINSPELAALRRSGFMHLSTSPSVLVEGDQASATSYTQLMALKEQGYQVWRIVVNRWEFRRESGRWLISKRASRPMAHDQSFDLMRGGLPLK